MSIKFKYKNNYLFNILSILFIILLFLTYYILFEHVKNPIHCIFLIILITIIIFIWMYLTKRKLEKTTGEFILDKSTLTYNTMKKSYYIDYPEIDYITKEKYNDEFLIFSKSSILYKVKIKNAGLFTFYYYDNSLINAIESLAKKAKIKIIDKTF